MSYCFNLYTLCCFENKKWVPWLHERRGGEHQTFSLWSLLNYLLPIFAWPAKLLCSSNHASVCIVVSNGLWIIYLWDSNIGLFVTKVFRSTMGGSNQWSYANGQMAFLQVSKSGKEFLELSIIPKNEQKMWKKLA